MKSGEMLEVLSGVSARQWEALACRMGEEADEAVKAAIQPQASESREWSAGYAQAMMDVCEGLRERIPKEVAEE